MNVARMIQFQRRFVEAREWNPFHTPKNLATSLMIEAAELAEQFQWLTGDESEKATKDRARRKCIEDEMADVLFYLLRLSDRLGVDLEKSFWSKMRQNAKKYPVRLAKGKAVKYTELRKQPKKKRR